MRRPFTVVHDWATLVADVTAHEPATLLLADVDPAVAGWHVDAAALREGFARIESVLLDALSEDGGLVWTTNTTRVAGQLGNAPHITQAGNRLLLGAGKPRLRRLRRELAGLLWRPDLVVIGDQWLIDGLLAWRLNARFVLWTERRPSPWWATLQQLAGLVLVRPLYRRERRRG